jgi:hypothetical protein
VQEQVEEHRMPQHALVVDDDLEMCKVIQAICTRQIRKR